jgi:hypothetical protein
MPRHEQAPLLGRKAEAVPSSDESLLVRAPAEPTDRPCRRLRRPWRRSRSRAWRSFSWRVFHRGLTAEAAELGHARPAGPVRRARSVRPHRWSTAQLAGGLVPLDLRLTRSMGVEFVALAPRTLTTSPLALEWAVVRRLCLIGAAGAAAFRLQERDRGRLTHLPDRQEIRRRTWSTSKRGRAFGRRPSASHRARLLSWASVPE